MSLDNPEAGFSPTEYMKRKASQTGPTEAENGSEQEEAPEDQQELEVDEVTEPEAEGSDSEAAEDTELFVFKADGEDRKVTADEYETYAQKGWNYNSKTEALADDRKSWEATKDKQQASLEADKNKMNEKIQQLEQIIGDEEKSIDWDELWDTDPAEAGKLKQKQEVRQTKLAEVRQEQQAQFEVQKQATISREIGHLNKTWTTDEQMKTGFDRANKALDKVGFTQKEIALMVDHRAFMIAEKAAKYDELMAKDPDKKQIKTPPKQIRPGKRAKSSGESAVKAAKERWEQDDSIKNYQAYLTAKSNASR